MKGVNMKLKSNKEAHAPNTKYGMGDNYGTGIRAKIGKMRDGLGMQTLTSKKLKTPPKSVV
jgi:hypothetical protein